MADNLQALVELYIFLQRRFDGLNSADIGELAKTKERLEDLWQNIINYK